MELYYVIGASVAILLLIAILWTISNDLKYLNAEIEDLHVIVNSQAQSIGELQRTTQQLLFREENKNL